MLAVPPAPDSTPRNPIPAVVSPATQVKVFTVFERSRGRADGAEGAIFLPSGAGLTFVFTAKNTLPARRVKWAGSLE